jgi:hypothetical protein
MRVPAPRTTHPNPGTPGPPRADSEKCSFVSTLGRGISWPRAVAAQPGTGAIFFADSSSIWRLGSPSGASASTERVAGATSQGMTGATADGPALSVELNNPGDMEFDPRDPNALFFVDESNYAVGAGGRVGGVV